MNKKFVIGVDGGGTKTDARVAQVIANGEFKILGTGTSRGSNPNRVGMDNATQNIESAINQAIECAKQKRFAEFEFADCCCLAIAGMAKQENVEQLKKWTASSFIARKVRVETDVRAAFAEGIESGAGIVLVAGTGSIAFGISYDGLEHRVGGLANKDGDTGSGFWIGSQLLNKLNEPNASIESEFHRAIDGNHESETDRAKEASVESPESIAAHAKTVCEFAAQENPICIEILTSGAKKLTRILEQTVLSIGMPSGDCEIAFTGSLLCKSALYRNMVFECIEQTKSLSLIKTEKIKLIPEPVLGAIKLAMESLD